MAFGAIELAARLIANDQSTHERYRQIQQIVLFLGTQESDLMLDFDAERFWKLKPNVSVDDPKNRLWQGRVSNSQGVRNEEFDLEKNDDVTRVVCFGDSSTFGIGNSLQETWPTQLEGLLNEHPDNPRSQVVNAGVPGYTSHQGLAHMRQEIDRLQPDVVIASYANNDFWHWDNKTDRDQAIRFNRMTLGRLLRKSRAVQVLDGWLAEDAQDAGKQEWAESTSLGYFRDDAAGVARVPLDHFESNLIEMADLCESKNVRLAFMLWPDQPQVAGQWSQRIAYQEVIKRVATDRGLQVADVVSEFHRNRSWSIRTYIPRDIVHVNKYGNRLAAIAAETAVLESGSD